MSNTNHFTFKKPHALSKGLAYFAFIFFILLSDLSIEAAIPVWLVIVSLLAFASLTVLKYNDLRGMLFIVVIITAILLGAFFVNDISHRKFWDVGKDVAVYLKIPLIFIFVIVIQKSLDTDSLLRFYIKYAVIFGALYLVLLPVYFALGILDISTIDKFGKSAPFVTYAFAIAASIMVLYPKLYSGWQFWLLVSVSIITTERRLWLVLLSALFVRWVWAASVRKKMTVMVLVAMAVVLSMTFGDATNRYTLLGVLHEVYGTEFKGRFEINDRWRAYELFMGISALAQAEPINWIFGLAPGYFVDLGLGTIKWGDGTWTGVPTFHNGYLFPLVKTGIFGLFGFFVLVYYFGWSQRRGNQWLHMRRFATLALLATTAVEFGIFGQGNCNMLLFLIFWFWSKEVRPLAPALQR